MDSLAQGVGSTLFQESRFVFVQAVSNSRSAQATIGFLLPRLVSQPSTLIGAELADSATGVNSQSRRRRARAAS